MNRVLLTAAVLAGLSVVAALVVHDGQARGQSGIPGVGTPPTNPTSLPWNESKARPAGGDLGYPMPNPRPMQPAWPVQQEGPDPNQEFFVTPAQGPWMIFITSYNTDRNTPDLKAKQLANQMVRELRSNYKLPAYVFNYGAEERRKEVERALKAIEKKKEELRKNGLSDQNVRERFMRIDIQCAILVGGYRDAAAARRDLERIKAIRVDAQDLARLPSQYDLFLIDARKFNEGKGKGENAKINPFLKAHVVTNPTLKQERPDMDKLDISVLKRLNAEEGLSLLKCKKSWTLAVKQFALPTVVQPKEANNGSFLQKLGLGGSPERVDAAAHSAHNMADFLRKANWEAYVLHTKFSSIVTIGSYDSLEDPRLSRDQEALAQWNARLTPPLPLFAQTMPMQVPR